MSLFQWSLFQATVLDTCVLIVCAFVLYRYARLTSAHPGFMYLIFHAVFFTARLYAVLGGSRTLFTGWHRALPVSQQEIARAGVLADVALVSMTVGLVLCSLRDRRRLTHSFARAEETEAFLSERVVRWVSIVAFPLGMLALLVYGAVPNAGDFAVNLGEWDSSSWPMVMMFWPVLVLLALIYFYGFRRILLVPMGMFLALMSIQGYNRFRVLLPVIFLLTTWQTRKGLRWPPKWMVACFLGVALLSFPMKELGTMIRQGEPLSDVADVASVRMSDVLSAQSSDQMVMDMFASVMWLVDESGRHFYGTMYYPLLVMPIPRQLWPDKPALNWYWSEIDSPARPMRSAGMVSCLLGESYANFGVFGVVAVPFFVGYWIGKFYFVAMRRPYFSVFRFVYVTVACCLAQVFRDGLFSVVVFPLVNMMPLMGIAGLSYFVFRRDRMQNDPRRTRMGTGRHTHSLSVRS